MWLSLCHPIQGQNDCCAIFSKHQSSLIVTMSASPRGVANIFFGHSFTDFPTEKRVSLLRWSHPDRPLDNDGSALLFITLKVDPSLRGYFFREIILQQMRGHCLNYFTPFFLRMALVNVRVAVGDFDQRVHDEEEQIFAIKSLFVHEKYHYALPLSYDIALVELEQPVQFGRFRPNHTHQFLFFFFLDRTAQQFSSPLLWSQQEVVSGQCASPCSRRTSLQEAAAL